MLSSKLEIWKTTLRLLDASLKREMIGTRIPEMQILEMFNKADVQTGRLLHHNQDPGSVHVSACPEGVRRGREHLLQLV